MSFSKAKIQRFNDIKEQTPSPADYNVQLKEKAKGAIIPPLVERFPESSQSPALSDTSSNKSQPVFRTPTLPKRKKTVNPIIPVDLASAFEHEELMKKTVECDNKDAYIKELTEQSDELKTKIYELKNEKSCLEETVRKTEEEVELLKIEHDNVLTDLTSKHTEQLGIVKQTIMNAKTELKVIAQQTKLLRAETRLYLGDTAHSLNQFQELYNESMRQTKDVIQEKDQKIQQLYNEIKYLQDQHQKLEKDYNERIANLHQRHNKDLMEVREQLCAHLKEFEENLKVTKLDILKVVKKISKIYNLKVEGLRSEHIDEKTKIIEENEAKIKLLEENFKEVCLLNEIQMAERIKQIENDCKEKVEEQKAILKECQEISEFTVIEIEIEKNKVKHQLQAEQGKSGELEDKLNVVLKQHDGLKESYNKLNIQFAKVVTELKEEKLKKSRDVSKEEMGLEKLLAEKRAFQITINTSQETIEVLKKRLLNSDKDVEQLKEELKATESKLVEIEGKCNELIREIERLKQQNEEKDMEIESTLTIAQNEVKIVERTLRDKVDEEFRKTSENFVERSLFLEVYEELHRQQKMLNKAHELTEKLNLEMERIESCYNDCENHNSELEQEKQILQAEVEMNASNIRDLKQQNEEKGRLIQEYKSKEEILENRIKKLESERESFLQISEYYKNKAGEYEAAVEETSELRKKYIEQSGKYDELLQKYETLELENAENKRIIAEQCSLIGPFKAQLEAFELERGSLMNEKNFLQHEAEMLGTKYADILGHQNHKQKIKHIQDLKNKIHDLSQSKLDLEKKVKYQAKIIEKLKTGTDRKKAKGMNGDDKENLQLSFNSSLNESALSPNPLRNRNN